MTRTNPPRQADGGAIPRRHPLSPSSAGRWMNCLGYYGAVKDLPPSPESKWAAEGTLAHSLLEDALITGLPAQGSPEMRRAVQVAVDYAAPRPKIIPEARILIPFQSLVIRGTSDIVILEDRLLEIVDYKHGVGVPVSAEANAQMSLYLAGAVHRFGSRRKYRMTIIQPRIQKAIQSIDLAPWELDQFLGKAETAIRTNLKGGGKLVAGGWCRFCPALPTCKTAKQRALGDDFND